MASMKPAAAVARWRSPTQLWLDHAKVSDADLEWMAPARALVLWNVRLPDEALAQLPNLLGVSLRDGSGDDLRTVQGCERLLCLDVNQVRGLHDVDALSSLRSLEFLSLYGLPRVASVPSLKNHDRLRHVQLGSMKGFTSLAGVADAPNLRTLQFIRAVAVTDDDVQPQPVLDRLGHLQRPKPASPVDWLADRLDSTRAKGRRDVGPSWP